MRTAIRLVQIVQARTGTATPSLLTFDGGALTFGGAPLSFQPS